MFGKMRLVVRVFVFGVRDGWDEPYELGSGVTFDEPEYEYLNEVYDRGVNLGQLVRSPLNHQR